MLVQSIPPTHEGWVLGDRNTQSSEKQEDGNGPERRSHVYHGIHKESIFAVRETFRMDEILARGPNKYNPWASGRIIAGSRLSKPYCSSRQMSNKWLVFQKKKRADINHVMKHAALVSQYWPAVQQAHRCGRISETALAVIPQAIESTTFYS